MDWTCDHCGKTKFNAVDHGTFTVCRWCKKQYDPSLHPDQQLNPGKYYATFTDEDVDRILDECLKEDPWKLK